MPAIKQKRMFNDFCGKRERKPVKCEACEYHHPGFRYRTCLFVRCPYDKTMITIRRPLYRPTMQGKEDREDWVKQPLQLL